MRFTFFALILIASSAFAQKNKNPSNVLFTLNKIAVTSDEFRYLYRKNHTKQEDFTEAKENEYLELLINFKLKIAEAQARGLDTTAAFIKEYKTYREELKRPYLAEADDLEKLTKEA